MELLGVKEGTLNWFRSYLNFRVLQTRVGDVKSDKITTYNQVSEGSQLSSTLFLIQVCDINCYLKHSKSYAFADDQVQSNAHEDIEIALMQAQENANITAEYFKQNKFAIQSDKTSMMIIRPSKSRKSQENKKHIIVDGRNSKKLINLRC